MKKLNLYKIIGIFVSFALFLVIFNQLKSGEPNFKVDESLFEVYESANQWEDSMNEMIPQLQLAREIGALNSSDRLIPILENDRDLIIHDVMVINFGAVYITYSFSLKENDQPFNLPTFHIGSLRFDGTSDKDQSFLVSQQEVLSQPEKQPAVINHRIYRAEVLYPNSEEADFIEEFARFSDADSVILENVYAQIEDEKIKLENQELALEGDFSHNIYAKADLNETIHTNEGDFTFTHFEAGLNANKLYMKGNDDLPTRLVMTNATEEDSYPFERVLLKDEKGTYVALEPFRTLQETYSYKVNEVVFNKNGLISKKITNEDWEAIQNGKKVSLGDYSGLTYTVHAQSSGEGNQLIIKIDGNKDHSPKLLNQIYMESSQAYEERLGSIPEEEREFYEQQKPVLLEIKDKNKSDILIYQTSSTESPKEFRIDLDYEHFSSSFPAVITLSYLPNFETVDVDLKGSLQLNEKID
ncbi:hypothetical protein [Pseudalkalibacillus hwajinpoensis]|uniref:hypothetical protein n=1 Tax=Guptibacillus hwajinpoensis TaxID=208199 RepID=UPI001CD686F0|nr:hypothetical protein [Pseudalkalibacillus hwajinpoensis]MCA0989892.1 hypothetical protein [Pseudalkalibacillus hwajinpoensis]